MSTLTPFATMRSRRCYALSIADMLNSTLLWHHRRSACLGITRRAQIQAAPDPAPVIATDLPDASIDVALDDSTLWAERTAPPALTHRVASARVLGGQPAA